MSRNIPCVGANACILLAAQLDSPDRMEAVYILLVAALLAEPGTPSPCCDCNRCGGKQSAAKTTSAAVSASFVVNSGTTSIDAREFAKHAEAMRQSLCAQWLGDKAAQQQWRPPCEIVLHRDRASYIRAVGAGGRSSSGSTLVRLDKDQVVVRRIDLFADREDRPHETLSHELVHAIFAERFPKVTPPRWAEEGAALLADTEVKRDAHRRDFARAHQSGRTFKMGEFLKMADYPAPERFPEFYGQSLVIAEFLAELGKPGDFVRFVDRSLATSPDEALKEVYQVESVQLERRWQEHSAQSALAALALPRRP